MRALAGAVDWTASVVQSSSTLGGSRTALDEAQHGDHHELPTDVEQVVNKPAHRQADRQARHDRTRQRRRQRQNTHTLETQTRQDLAAIELPIYAAILS